MVLVRRLSSSLARSSRSSSSSRRFSTFSISPSASAISCKSHTRGIVKTQQANFLIYACIQIWKYSVTEGWAGLVGWPTFYQRSGQVNHRSGKVCQPKADVLTTEPCRQPSSDMWAIYAHLFPEPRSFSGYGKRMFRRTITSELC